MRERSRASSKSYDFEARVVFASTSALEISSVVDSRREMSPFIELMSSAMRASRSAICASRSARAILVDSAVSSFAATRPRASSSARPSTRVPKASNSAYEVFELVSAAEFASTRFRIRLTEIEPENDFEENWDDRCMHICGFELYGTILPPWRID